MHAPALTRLLSAYPPTLPTWDAREEYELTCDRLAALRARHAPHLFATVSLALHSMRVTRMKTQPQHLASCSPLRPPHTIAPSLRLYCSERRGPLRPPHTIAPSPQLYCSERHGPLHPPHTITPSPRSEAFLSFPGHSTHFVPYVPTTHLSLTRSRRRAPPPVTTLISHLTPDPLHPLLSGDDVLEGISPHAYPTHLTTRPHGTDCRAGSRRRMERWNL